MKKRWMVVGVAMALGCASAPEREPLHIEVDTPARWTAGQVAVEAPSAEAARWWSRFGDERLDSLVAEALVHNLNRARNHVKGG